MLLIKLTHHKFTFLTNYLIGIQSTINTPLRVHSFISFIARVPGLDSHMMKLSLLSAYKYLAT
jgi:hypothetical protein